MHVNVCLPALELMQHLGCGVQSGDAEKDKLRASLGSAILAERPNVKVSVQAAATA